MAGGVHASCTSEPSDGIGASLSFSIGTTLRRMVRELTRATAISTGRPAITMGCDADCLLSVNSAPVPAHTMLISSRREIGLLTKFYSAERLAEYYGFEKACLFTMKTYDGQAHCCTEGIVRIFA